MGHTNSSGILWYKRINNNDFDIQKDHLISARRPDLVIVNKKKRNCQIVDYAVPADHRVRLKESEKKDKYQDFAWELKETMENESNGDIICSWCSWYSYQMISTGTGEYGNKKTSGDHPNDSVIKIGLNTEKSPGDLRELAFHWNTIG